MAFLELDIHSFVSEYLIQPLYNTISYGFWLVSSATDELMFLEYEREPLLTIVPWKDTLMFTFTVVMAYIWYLSWKAMQQEKYECEQISKSCDTDISDKLSEFSKQTDSCFKDMERRCKEIENRLARAQALTGNERFNEKFEEELNETRGCWVSNFSTFSMMDLQMGSETNGEWAQIMELLDIEQDFDAAISEIEGTLAAIDVGVV